MKAYLSRWVGFVGSALCGLGTAGADPRELEPVLDRWFARQAETATWSAEFVQTRHLKALTQPLVSKGRVWFEAPNSFRWELGEPAETIAVRQPERLLVLYPRLRRAEIYPVGSPRAGGAWREALALLEAGFPSTRAQLDERFSFQSVARENELVRVVLEPRSEAARKLMPRFTLWFAPADLSLRATGLEFGDGSILRNEFENVRVNPRIEPGLFELEPGPEFTIVEPLAR